MTMPTSDRQPNQRDEHLTEAELNELVDGTLAGRDLTRAQAHLESCQECDERYRTLMATVSALQSAPALVPRRSFQLTPEQAKLPPPKPSWFDRFAEWIVPGIPVIKTATVAVALLLISVTAFDVLTNQSGQDDMNSSTTFQREVDVPAPAADNVQPAPTDLPLLGESEEVLPDASDAVQESGAESDSSDMDQSAAESAIGGAIDGEATDEPLQSSAMQEAPAAPAPASVIEQPTSVASPTASPLASPVPLATPAPDPTSESEGWSASVKLSWWRIAELGLLMILAWLVVSWIGRSRVEKTDD